MGTGEVPRDNEVAVANEKREREARVVRSCEVRMVVGNERRLRVGRS
jgi:hypothetical protein